MHSSKLEVQREGFQQYLHLQLLGLGVVDEEDEGLLPHRLVGLVSDLEGK